jgi:hypothetical protein
MAMARATAAPMNRTAAVVTWEAGVSMDTGSRRRNGHTAEVSLRTG